MKKGSLIQMLVIIPLILIPFITAEKLSIQIGDSYTPGEIVKFKITLYSDDNSQIKGIINYKIQDFYKEIIYEGTAESGEETSFQLPADTRKGYAAVIAQYNGLEQTQLFNVMELEKISIKLEEDYLVISNEGNTEILSKQISISIGEHHETALVSLAIGQVKKIRLTAPQGEYDIRVSDGTEENTFEVKEVSLTGNVIGLERLKEKSFWEEYPLVILFLFSIIVIALVIGGLRFRDRYLK